LCFAAALLLAGCTGDGNTEIQPAAVAPDSPDSFLTYPNTQASLAAGDYQLQVGPASGTAAGSYTLAITRDDGSVQNLSGSWPAGGTNPVTISLDHAGGLKIEASAAVPVALVLNRVQDPVAPLLQVVARGTGSIDLPASRISSDAYAQAYYDAVDPTGERTTLAAWKHRNGFDNGYDTHVIFRDAMDLGYGRDMYVRKNSDGSIAVYVNNYVVTLQQGSSSNYGPLNVDAAISHDARYLQGTNAIEFSPANEDGASVNGAMKITKFFTFDKNGNRITSANLDGRGLKSMPGTCWSCHGGQTLPLDQNGKFQPESLRSAKFNLIDLDRLEYSLQDGYHRDQLEPGLRIINQYVADSYSDIKARDINDGATNQGKWGADFGQELAAGNYNHGISPTFIDGFVPAGWQEGSGRPVGVSTLYTQVVRPHCIACHSLQGRAVTYEPGTDDAGNTANAINFSSYEKFISYRSRIADYVFRRGIMPLSLRNFESFWKDPAGAPSLLASFLADPSLYDSHGKVIEPGNPVARPGADRIVVATAALPAQLDGSASYFADSYHWEITSGAAATLDNPDTARPTLVAPSGTYVLALTVTNSRGSNTAAVTYTVDNSGSLKSQRQLTFVDDVEPLFTSYGCTGCHASNGLPGIPVYWTTAADSNGVGLYDRVMARVDLRDPEASRFLLKPTGSVGHGGGTVIDTSTPSGQADYNTLLNWIREGAVCGVSATLCP
jgi:mono/diheme cytochrome c family protein